MEVLVACKGAASFCLNFRDVLMCVGMIPFAWPTAVVNLFYDAATKLSP
jgi:hypothetical protein